ncbi:glycosyltransferase family 2 protein [Echinicola marina]|uniref:glycosyltransferase family 2 protein n=1 Tax=Echinicola marina TaxID=2859768 RepID=UPI001CF691B7|nr:glycosyltransferase family 2 protein [Echinicola marina]UCS92431.1 glycosyltransferase family 2 protein [Echinicola marina]
MNKKEIIFNISVVIPCYNEALNVKDFYNRIKKTLSIYENYEIIFIDDGSTDTTLFELKNIACIDTNVRYLSFSRNFGHQNALLAGLNWAKGDCIISLDCDLQHPPELIPKMVKIWMEGYKIVNTIRESTQKISLFKRISSSFFYKAFNYLTGERIEKGTSDFRLLDKSVVKNVVEMAKTSLFIRGTVSWLGYKTKYIKFNAPPRSKGKSSYSVLKMINLAISGITYFGITPLRLSFNLGLFVSLIAFLYGIYAIGIHLFSNNAVPGWTSVIVSVLFLSGVQLTMFGIIGEYIGKTFLLSQDRPNYIIEETNIKYEKELFIK